MPWPRGAHAPTRTRKVVSRGLIEGQLCSGRTSLQVRPSLQVRMLYSPTQKHCMPSVLLDALPAAHWAAAADVHHQHATPRFRWAARSERRDFRRCDGLGSSIALKGAST